MEKELTLNRELLKRFWNHLATGPFATSVAIFTPDTVEKQITEFLLLEKAAKELDEKAQAEGYANAADKALKLKQKAQQEEATRAAEERALREAEERKEKERIEQRVKEEQELQAQRDKEDAERRAQEMAEDKAKTVADHLANHATPDESKKKGKK